MSNTSRKSVDLATKPLTTISGHEQSISSIAYLPGGERVVSCSDDKTVRIWGVGNAEQEGTSMEHEDQLYALAVTRDGKRILSGGDDRRIKVWDAETHELIEEWESPEDGILSIALSPDDRLVANGDGKGKIVIREMKEGGEIKHSIEAGSSVTSVYSLCFSPNGEKLACAVNKQTPRDVRGGVGDYTIQVYDIESGELILGPIIGHEDWVRSVLWSLDGIQLFSGSDDHSIRCWDSDTGEPIGELWTGHTDQVNSLSLSFDGTKLASSSSDRTVRFWDAHSGDPIGQPLHHDNHLWAVALSPSGEFVASGGMDEKISIWRVPWWDDSKKEPHKSFLDLPAVPVFKNDQQQNGLDFLDLPTSRRPFTSSHRPPTDSTTTLTVKRVQRFWRGLVARRTSSSPQQGIELNEMQDRRFWKSPVRTPVTEVAAGRLTDRVKVGRREPRRKKKKDEKSRKPKKSQAHTSSSAAEAGPSSNAEQSGSTSNAGPSNSQAGPSTASNTAPVGRSSSFAQSNTGSDDSWDDMDCGEQCVDYFCFGPRENRERFRPWKKKTRAVIEAEERAKKEKRKKNTRKHRKKIAERCTSTASPRPPKGQHPRGIPCVPSRSQYDA
ncbi:hypothetical protein PAXINDRAFT_172698 [Paxillus involutus ATCC 200175]|uniref:WD40 repeat-like protein n=1 Tax=Paxillus involutus ATCC 200175 TaxID=664439 RepID=A0A0C9TD58_PAXIN|nr:hypothetical protein PAXINDRAFT_172698 [Paxillus involutus ATCC 200175]